MQGYILNLLILVSIRWVVLAVVVFFVLLFRERIFGGASSERRAISQMEGLAAWTESLRDMIAAS